MLKGVRSIYVDFVDYDEIAHHAGILRPESLEALEAVDACSTSWSWWPARHRGSTGS